jgi:hypothetical protein
MKTAILTAALIVLMTVAYAENIDDTTTTSVSAGQVFKAWVYQPEENIIKFRVINPDTDKVVLKIYNDDNVKVFHRTVKVEKKSISCEMSNCASGTYTCVVVRNGHEEVRKLISLNR